jgi:hypothetical protein
MRVAGRVAAAEIRLRLDDPPRSDSLGRFANQPLAQKLASDRDRVAGVKLAGKRQKGHSKSILSAEKSPSNLASQALLARNDFKKFLEAVPDCLPEA